MAKLENQNNDAGNLNKSTVNLTLNTIIFILAAVIIYLTYSISIKLSDGEKAKNSQDTKPVAAEVIQVEILNGCGISGIADRFTDYLRANGFDVVNRGNYKSFEVENTIIIDRRGNIANAVKTADILGVKQKSVIQQLNEDYFLDVTIIVGKDYFSLTPLN